MLIFLGIIFIINFIHWVWWRVKIHRAFSDFNDMIHWINISNKSLFSKEQPPEKGE